MKALIITDNEFEDSEVLYPYYRLKEEGMDVKIASSSFDIICGKYGHSIQVDLKPEDVNADDYNILLLPGGKAPEKVRQDKDSIHIVKSFVKKGKVIGAICHGPQVLISAGVLKGKKCTGYSGIKDDLMLAGANYSDKEVVVDGNLITSRKPDDLPAFMREVISKMKSSEKNPKNGGGM